MGTPLAVLDSRLAERARFTSLQQVKGTYRVSTTPGWPGFLTQVPENLKHEPGGSGVTAERAVGTLHHPCSLHPTGTPPGFSVLKLSPSFSAPRGGDFGLRGENTDVLQSRNTKPAASYRHVQLTAARQPGDAGKQTPPEHRHLFFFFFLHRFQKRKWNERSLRCQPAGEHLAVRAGSESTSARQGSPKGPKLQPCRAGTHNPACTTSEKEGEKKINRFCKSHLWQGMEI